MCLPIFLQLGLDQHSYLALCRSFTWQKSIPLHSNLIHHCCKVSYCFLQQCLYTVASNPYVRAWPSDTSPPALRVELQQKWQSCHGSGGCGSVCRDVPSPITGMTCGKGHLAGWTSHLRVTSLFKLNYLWDHGQRFLKGSPSPTLLRPLPKRSMSFVSFQNSYFCIIGLACFEYGQM